MKILLVANTDWYLFNFRLLLAQALRDRGHEVVLVSPPGGYASRLQEAGFRWLPASISRRGTNPLREFNTLLRLARIYRRERPALVSHFTIKPVLYGSLAARLARVPRVINAVTGLGYVFTAHGREAATLRSIVKPLYRFALRDTQIIFQNEVDRQEILRGGLAQAEQTHLIPSSGIDLRRFIPSPLPPGPPVVLFNGRMLWSKGVGEFVAAARVLRKQGVPARFWLVGDSDEGNPESIPAAQLRAWQTEGVVEWLGWRDDVPNIMAQTTLVCFPSYAEGFPRALLEAAASGRAAVTTAAPGCADAVIDGETGLIVPVRDPDALARALASLLADPQRCARMGEAGRKFVESRFSADLIINRTMAVYFSED